MFHKKERDLTNNLPIRRNVLQIQIQVESEVDIAKPEKAWAIKEDSLEAVLTSNLLLLFLLGYEQTSTVMAACMFFLARDPHIQGKYCKYVKQLVKHSIIQLLFKENYENYL